MIRLETPRLLIRNFMPDDWKALQEIVLLFQASPYGSYDYPWPTSDIEMQGVCGWFSQGDSFVAVCLKESSAVIGYIALNGAESPGERNLGYCFHYGVHGQGYAFEACTALLHLAFSNSSISRVVSGTAEANLPSRKLLARLGFRKTSEAVTSFCKTEEGNPIEFLGYGFELTREQFGELIASTSSPAF
jgi:[ribosomal protein S5]-alanine N-acetyltransferase